MQAEDSPFPQHTVRPQIPLLENTNTEVDPEKGCRQLRVDHLVSPSLNTPLTTLHTNTGLENPKQVPRHEMSLMQNTKLGATTAKLRQLKENRLASPSPNKLVAVTPQNNTANPTIRPYDYPTQESHNSVDTLSKISGYGHQSHLPTTDF